MDKIVAFLEKPRNILTLAWVFGGVCMLCYLCFSFDIYRDVANCYAYMAREFGRMNWSESFDSRLPLLNITLAGVFCLAGMEAFSATILVSGAFFLLTIPALYSLLKRFLSPTWAAWGCMLYIVSPKMIRFAGGGLLESGRNFFLVAALCFLFRIFDRRKFSDCVWLGISLGGLSLARSEGLAVALMLIAFLPLIFFYLRKRQPVSPGKAAGITAAVLAVYAVTLIPVTLYNYRESGYPVPDVRMVEIFAPGRRTAAAPIPSEPPKKKVKLGKRIVKTFRDLIRGTYELYAIFAVLGILLVLWRRQWRWEYTLFLIIIALHCVIYFAVSSSFRYYTLAIPLLMVFVIEGLLEILRQLRRLRCYRRVQAVLLIGGAVLLVLQLWNGLEIAFRDQDDAVRQTAVWLKERYSDRRIVLAASELPELTFWSDFIAANGYKHRILNWETDDHFELVAVPVDEKHLLNLLRTRKDLVVLEHPCSDEIVLFEKRKAE